MKRGIGRKDMSPTPPKPRFKFCDRFSPDQRATRNELRLIEVRCKRRNSRKCTGCCARHGAGRKKKKRKESSQRRERSNLNGAFSRQHGSLLVGSFLGGGVGGGRRRRTPLPCQPYSGESELCCRRRSWKQQVFPGTAITERDWRRRRSLVKPIRLEGKTETRGY